MPLHSPWRYTDDKSTVVVTDSCFICGKLSEVEVPVIGFLAWQLGEKVQEAFPELSADDRETLISGIHGGCFDREFGEELCGP